jgi:hypothetical protein
MEFDALQYLGTNAEECICFGKGASAAAWLRPGCGLILRSPSGEFIIEQNDWIIKLAENNFHRCRGHLFHILYEPVEKTDDVKIG